MCKFRNWIKWLLIKNGSKIVTVGGDPITDVQTVKQKIRIYKGVTTNEWNGKIVYSMDDIRFATREEIRLGVKLK